MIKLEAFLISCLQSQNWYKPLPGVPYRPLFGFPDRIRQEIPSFKYCNAFGFTAFDPPKKLTPALALAPDVTTDEAKAPSKTPETSAVHDPGPKKIDAVGDPANSKSPTPADKPPVPSDPNLQRPAQSADPANSKFPTPAGDSPVLPDPKLYIQIFQTIRMLHHKVRAHFRQRSNFGRNQTTGRLPYS